MKISAGRDLVGYGAFLNETFLGGPSCGYGWRFQDVGSDIFSCEGRLKILMQNHMKSMSVRSVRCFSWALLIVCDARCLGRTILPRVSPRFAYLDSSRSDFALPVSVFVCFFVVHISFSLIHTLLYALTNLPNKFGDYSYQ